MPAPPHHSVDVRDFLSEFSRSPLHAIGDFGALIGRNAIHHWWAIALVSLTFAGLRFIVRRERDRNTAQKTMRRASGRVSRRRYARRSMILSLTSVLISSGFIIVVAGLCGLSMNPQTFSWVLGSISLTAAFVARPYLADAVAAFAHIAQDAYGIGDYVDAGFGIEGTVVDISLWVTRLRDADGTIWEIHNGELMKFGNRTKSAGRLLTDVTMIPADESFVTSAQVDQWESLISESLIGLRSTLRDVDVIARSAIPVASELDTAAVAQVVPSLLPDVSADTLAQIRDLDPDDTGALPTVRRALKQTSVGATPLFRDIEVLGLVSAQPTQVTIRIRVTLVDPRTRTHALAVLRRTLFDAFNPLRVATQFADVPDSELLG